jgi:indolepyruvate ferredoxin oxidoreductase alpha subunit
MGNEAIAYGALEAGTSVITGYPGTPSSEVLETIFYLMKRHNIQLSYAEWAINERVAFEIGLGAALAGARTLVTMKGPGANVASDPMVSATYCGTNAGLVVLVADDPGPHTTQTEQDSRWYGDLMKLPVVEPIDPQDAHDLTIKAFEFSEKVKLPFILRTTTRVNHAVGDVVVGEFKKREFTFQFEYDPLRFIRANMPQNRMRHAWVLDRLKGVEEVTKGINLWRGDGEKGVIATGVTYNYVMEVLEEEGRLDEYSILKLGLIYPLPIRLLKEFLSSVREVTVVEEIDPYIEEKVKKLAYDWKLNVDIKGREEGLLPPVGEVNPSHVRYALLGKRPVEVEEVKLPKRPPPMCPGCPHIGSFYSLARGLARAGLKKKDVPVFGDIGCYALSINPPFESLWTEHSMGASISMAAGIKAAGFEGTSIAVIGDSTFFHAGLPSLIDAINKRLDILVFILDNGTVAMTGHQSTPEYEVSESGRRLTPVDIEKVIRSLGIEDVAIVDPYDLKGYTEKVTEFAKKPGVKVIIAKRECAILRARKGVETVHYVIADKCTNCLACTKLTGCPALLPTGEKVMIIEEECVGCDLCAQVCPFDAIVPVKRE